MIPGEVHDRPRVLRGGLVVLAPLWWEARALRRGLSPEARVVRTGMGPRRSRRAVVPPSASAVVVAGVCGALDPSLGPGALVVASELHDPDGSVVGIAGAERVAESLRAIGLEVQLGPVASVTRLFLGVDRAVLTASGAIAVDMESVWLARAAGDRPLVVVRTVADGPGRHLLRNPIAAANAGRTALRVLSGIGPALEAWAADPRR